jgi:isopentenyl-diphosphate Delta-isomerase
MEQVLLVDENDQELGVMEKMQAHREGLLHRAFSVLIFNSKNELLLQKRAVKKYHSGGLWTNTCCSHPRPEEQILTAANRRLKEEMGIQTELNPLFHFIYKTELDNDMIEHELDHVLIGISDSLPNLNLEEAEDYRFISLSELNNEIKAFPDNFTVWFKIIIQHYQDYLTSNGNQI